MKICVQVPVNFQNTARSQKYFASLQEHFRPAKRPETEIVIKDVPTGYGRQDQMEFLNYGGTRLFNDVEILRSVLAAEKAGFDAVSISCYFDPALYEARQLLQIPVTGLAESSMHLASMMGAKFAVITLTPLFIPPIEANIVKYGMEAKIIRHNPVRCLTLAPEKMQKIDEAAFQGGEVDYTPLRENFTVIARDCIADGAEVLIVGCGGLSPVVKKAGINEVDGVPVIEPMIASLKFAEMLVDFQRAGMPFVSRGLSLAAVPPNLKNILIESG
jgi:allantoin racemase